MNWHGDDAAGVVSRAGAACNFKLRAYPMCRRPPSTMIHDSLRERRGGKKSAVSHKPETLHASVLCLVSGENDSTPFSILRDSPTLCCKSAEHYSVPVSSKRNLEFIQPKAPRLGSNQIVRKETSSPRPSTASVPRRSVVSSKLHRRSPLRTSNSLFAEM